MVNGRRNLVSLFLDVSRRLFVRRVEWSELFMRRAAADGGVLSNEPRVLLRQQTRE